MKNIQDRFNIYVNENLDKIYRLAFSIMKNQHDAEDVVNEAVIKALKSIKNLKNEEYFETWMYRIVINTGNTALKQRNKVIYLDENEEQYKNDEYVDTDLYNVIMSLDEKYRMIIVLRFFEDMKIEKVAEIINENINTTKTRLYAAINIIKQKIGEEFVYYE